MKFIVPLLFISTLVLPGQVAAPAVQTKPAAATPAPDTVIATIEGKKLTFGELQSYLAALDPQRQKLAMRDPAELVRQYAVMKHLAAVAEQSKLDQKSPYKEAIASSRMQVLTNAQLNEEYLRLPVTQEDQLKFYNDNKDRYTEVKLKVIYIPFVAKLPASDSPASDSKGKSFLTEAQAKAKIEGILKEVRGGSDFVQLAKQYSEDDKSKSQNGDFGTLRKSDNLPDEIKSVVFELKKGEVSEPVRQRNGFYLFKAEEIGMRPFNEVETDIFNELKNTRMREWLEKLGKSIPVKVEDPSFFARPPS
ncbi:MAG: peptidylprolyl isomerase [Acidobacteriota bacterium]|nr:peptidylprolyl isomerase [Acidobacteriota bacterium]